MTLMRENASHFRPSLAGRVLVLVEVVLGR